MLQAIITKYMGPTNYRPGRVKATAQAGSVTVDWDHALGISQNHEAAAKALADKYGWLDGGWTLAGGGMPASGGYAFVLLPPKEA